MKKLILLFLLLTGMFSVNAQDIITLKNGDEIKAKVTEISSSEIKYKRFDNLEGPTIVIAKSEVFVIKYENGTREVINAIDGEKQTTVSKTASDNECTIIFYRKNKPIPLILAALVVEVKCKNPNNKICNLWNGSYYKLSSI